MPPPSQLDLFGGPPAPPGAPAGAGPVAPAPEDAAWEPLARRLPASVRLGTSSWAFPGWEGLVYGGAWPRPRLSRDGLAAYSAHPLLRAVGVDRTLYAPLDADAFAAYARQVPDGFRFLVKAHEALTLARFPRHARYGRHRGERNPRFLDAGWAADAVVAPFVEGLGAKAGPLLFQLAPQAPADLGPPERFAAALHRFLGALPRGPLYAVEVRNAGLLTEAYAEALADVGACHCVALLPGMPDPHTQWARTRGPRQPALVARWMLARHLRYEEAKARWAPFDRLAEPDPTSRAALARLVADATALGLPATVIVNNKAEGSAPRSVVALAEALAATLEADRAGGTPP